MESSVGKHLNHLSGSNSSCPPEHRVRARAMLTPEQYTALSSLWAETQFPTTHQRVELAERISMRPRTVQVWFQNQRQKTKRQSVLQAESASNLNHHLSRDNEQTYSAHVSHSSPPPAYGTYSYHHSIISPAAPHHPNSHSLNQQSLSTSVHDTSTHAFSAPVEPTLHPPPPPVKNSVMAPPIAIDVVVRPADRNPPYFPPPGIAPESGHRGWDSQNKSLLPFNKQVQWDSPPGKTSWPAEHHIHNPVPSSSFPIGHPATLYRSQSTHPYLPWGPPSPVRRQSLGHYHPYDGSSIGSTPHSAKPSLSEPAKNQQLQPTYRSDIVSSLASTPFSANPSYLPAASTSLASISASESELVPRIPDFKSSTTTSSSMTTTTTTTVLNANSVNQSPVSMKLPSFKEFLQSTVSPESDLPVPTQTPSAESGEPTPPSPSSLTPSSASFAPPIPVTTVLYPPSFLQSFGSRSGYNSRRSA